MSSTKSHKFIFLLSLSSLILTFSAAAVNRECLSAWRDPSYKCPSQPNIVCAYFTGENCESDSCKKVALNPCTACQDTSVTHFTDGTCEFNKIFCDDNSRSFFPAECSLDGAVCGYYKEGCPVEICGVDMQSGCEACRDPKILYYRLGFCNIHEAVNSCPSDDSCDRQFNPGLFSTYNPVCAFRENCVGQNCARTFDNECTACTTSGYKQFKRGICDQGRTECADIKRPLSCQGTSRSPVCAYFALPESLEPIIGRSTATNSCNACLDTTVKYFTKGTCSTKDKRTYCLPYMRPTSCSNTDEPVCGYAADENGFYTYKNMANSCEACRDSNVIFHEPGACEFKCRGDEADEDGACSGSIVEPVCAKYTNSRGRTAYMSVKSKCVACNDLDFPITSYTEGLCSGSNREIKCADDPASFYYGEIFPVCATLEANCRKASCKMTFAEPIVACNYPAVSYVPGVCPGDQGISCDVYRKQRRTICSGKSEWTERVCGYTRANCRSSSCRRTYQNQCYACDNASVLYFEKGAC